MGSGKWVRASRKQRVEEACGLNVRELQRKGLLVAGATFTLRPGLDCLCGSGVVTVRRPRGVSECLWLEWSPCRFGGARPWFRCPDCERLCGALYDQGGRFRCRTCANLAYRTQQTRREVLCPSRSQA
jgi:hypothetical protein